MKSIDESVSILGVTVFSGSFEEALKKIELALEYPGERALVVFTPNPEQLVQSREKESFKSALQKADMAIPDGVGLVWAARLLSNKSLTPIAGIDLAESAVLKAMGAGQRVLLVGGGGESAEKTARAFIDKSQNINEETDGKQGLSIQWDGGAVDIARETDAERERVLGRIRTFRPALVLVAYGAPWQEQWVNRNRGELEKAGVKVVMVVGGAFDVWAQKVRRAPLGWRKNGLEWLWRLIQQPWRWRRQTRLLRFIGLVVQEKLKKSMH